MSYESKIIVVERNEFPTWTHGDELCRVNVSAMGYHVINGKTFTDIFTNEIDFDLYVKESNGDIVNEGFYRKDYYGEICKWASLDTVIKWLREYTTKDNYRRAKLLLKVLEGIKECVDDYSQVCVVHFGY